MQELEKELASVSQFLCEDHLAQAMEQRVKYVRELSKEIPFYARKYKELGIDPDEIRTPQDLLKAYQKGLYTTGDDLPYLTTDYDVFRQYFITSGTSGKGKIVAITRDDLKRATRQCERSYSSFINENDIILNCFPSSPAVSGTVTIEGISPFPIKLFHASAQTLSDVEMFLTYYHMFKPSVIFGLTTSVYRLPIKLIEKGINSQELSINKILTGGEPSSIEKRKTISKEFGEAEVYDWYASSENMIIAYERTPLSNEYEVTTPDTLLFLVKDSNEVSEGEIGDVLITNLYEIGENPHMILLNYKIGDWAKCLRKRKDHSVSLISDIRRWAAYLAGAKLDPTEIEKAVEELKEGLYRDKLSGEYTVINYHDKEDRKAVGEIRVESKKKLSPEEKEEVAKKLREEIYLTNIPVKTLVEEIKDAKLLIEITDPGELYKGYEKHIKPGKPIRLLNFLT